MNHFIELLKKTLEVLFLEVISIEVEKDEKTGGAEIFICYRHPAPGELVNITEQMGHDQHLSQTQIYKSNHPVYWHQVIQLCELQVMELNETPGSVQHHVARVANKIFRTVVKEHTGLEL